MRARDYRDQARLSLTGKWMMAALATFLVSLMGGISTGPNFEMKIDLGSEQYRDLFAEFPQEYMVLVAIATLVIVLLAIAAAFAISSFFSGVVLMGYKKSMLDVSCGSDVDISSLFCRFRKGIYMKSVKLCFLQGLYVFAWSLLCVIPGIIAEYSYYMAYYIMLDHPELTPAECLRASKNLMRGNKWRLFCLHWSFFGWQLLSVFSCGIGDFFLQPYMHTADAFFYRDLTRGVNIQYWLY